MESLVELALDTHLPLQTLLSKVENGRIWKKRGYNEMQELANTDTLYGQLLGLLPIPGADGKVLHAEYIDPCALLSWAAATSLPFFRLVQWCVTTSPQKRLRFCLYHDGVTPGNNLRPDLGRSFLSFLWVFLEMPLWLRNRGRVRWFTMTYILKRVMKDYGIHVRDITKAILLKLFRHGDFNLSQTGILLEHGTEKFLVVLIPTCVAQDYEAHQVMFDLKGPSGLNPCPFCDNCIGRRAYFEDDSGFEHVLSPRYDKFKVRDASRIHQIAAELKNLAAQGATKALDDTEKATGLVYREDGLLFDDAVSSVFEMPHAIYCDLTHCVSASGGIGQFTINQFVLSILSRTKLTLKDICEFASKVQWPKSHSRISKNWFEERIVNKSGAHCRGFASETLAVVDVLGLFIEVVLNPMEVLQEEIMCFSHLRDLLGCLRRGGIEDAPAALRAAQKHHESTMKLHPEACKPKHHYTMHALLAWMLYGVLITCFGAESEHKQPKRLMNHCYNRCNVTCLKYWIRTFSQHLQDPETWAQTFLVGTLRTCETVLHVFGLGTITLFLSSPTVTTSTGTYHKGDFVHWESAGVRGGIAECFLMGHLENGKVVFVAVVSGHNHVAAGLWTSAHKVLVNVERLEGATIFLKEKGAWVRPLLPARL